MTDNQETRETEKVAEETAEETAEKTADAEETAQEAEAVEEKAEEPETPKDKKDNAKSEVEVMKDRLMRQMAEFDNYRKRTEKEKAANYEIGAADFIQKILPVVDNFERGLGSISEEEKSSSFAQGIEMVYKQLTKALEDAGVTAIETEGKEFDPMLHNAVMQQASDTVESGYIIQEFQKGYKYKDRVIRHSMVVVAE